MVQRNTFTPSLVAHSAQIRIFSTLNTAQNVESPLMIHRSVFLADRRQLVSSYSILFCSPRLCLCYERRASYDTFSFLFAHSKLDTQFFYRTFSCWWCFYFSEQKFLSSSIHSGWMTTPSSTSFFPQFPTNDYRPSLSQRKSFGRANWIKSWRLLALDCLVFCYRLTRHQLNQCQRPKQRRGKNMNKIKVRELFVLIETSEKEIESGGEEKAEE